MKSSSDNLILLSIFKIIGTFVAKNISIIVYDDSINSVEIEGVTLVCDFKMLTKTSDLIARNKLDNQIQPFSYKVFSRDIFSTD